MKARSILRKPGCSLITLAFIMMLHLPCSKLQEDTTLPQNEQSQSRLLQVLEQALQSDSQNLYNLRKAFFNPDGKSPARVNISVITTVGKIQESYAGCNNDEWNFDDTSGRGFVYCHEPDDSDDQPDECDGSPCQINCWVRSNTKNSTDIFTWADTTYKLGTINDLLLNNKVWDTLASIDYFILLLLTNIPAPSLDDLAYRNMYYEQMPELKLSLNVSELDFMPCEEDLIETVKVVLVWAKAYARNGGQMHFSERSESDRGVALIKNSYWEFENSAYAGYSESVISNIIVSIFFILNFLTIMLAYFYLEKITQYCLSNPYDSMVCHLYWSLSILASMFTLSTYIGNLATTVNLGLLHRHVLYIEIITFILMVTLEPFIAWQASKAAQLPINDYVFTYNFCATFPCLCFILWCMPCIWRIDSCVRWKTRICHTLSLLSILWFVHRLESSVIVSVIMVVNNPPVMVISITLIILVILCTFVIIYSLFTLFIARKYTRCYKTCIHVLLILVFWTGVMILIIITGIMYIAFLDGMNYSTLGGFILAVIPPIVIFVLIGLYFRKRFTNRDRKEAQNNLDTANQQRQRPDSIQAEIASNRRHHSINPRLPAAVDETAPLIATPS